MRQTERENQCAQWRDQQAGGKLYLLLTRVRASELEMVLPSAGVLTHIFFCLYQFLRYTFDWRFSVSESVN